MFTHILYGSIDDSNSGSGSCTKSSESNPSRESPGPHRGKKCTRDLLKKYRINPEDVLQLSSESSSMFDSGADKGQHGAKQVPAPHPQAAALGQGPDDWGSRGAAAASHQAAESAESAESNDELPSVGSAMHAQGNCQVCMFAQSASGCVKGQSCSFCHIPHKRAARRKNKMRPCKGKRERYHRLMGYLTSEILSDPASFTMDNVKLPPSIAENETAKTKLMTKINTYLTQVRLEMNIVGRDSAPAISGNSLNDLMASRSDFVSL